MRLLTTEMHFSRPRLWPTVFSVPVVLLCLGLGFWQIQRLHWKRGLIAARHAAVIATPVPLPKTRAEAHRMEFRHVIAEGRFLNGKEILVYATAKDGESGYHVLTPLRERTGGIVFVNRGFVPTRLKDPRTRAAGEIAGPVRVTGLLRQFPAKRPGWFIPDNHPRQGEWFWLDRPAMIAEDGLADVAPFYIDADSSPVPGGWPRGGTTILTLPNHHLQYAITWFSLAGALVVIYVLYHRKPADSAQET